MDELERRSSLQTRCHASPESPNHLAKGPQTEVSSEQQVWIYHLVASVQDRNLTGRLFSALQPPQMLSHAHPSFRSCTLLAAAFQKQVNASVKSVFQESSR